MEEVVWVYGVKITHIYNAACIYESQGVRLLSDPWLIDGAFEGSWAAYPPLKTKVNDLLDCDYLYISHLHPDHYDAETLLHFDKKKLIIIYEPSKGMNFLKNKLMSLGFENFISLKDGESYVIPPFKFTIYGPFCKHPFYDSQLGNFIDSSLVIEADGECILNANDNMPNMEAAMRLRKKHGPFTLTQLKDSLAGPYPSCFPQLSAYEKQTECLRLVNRQMGHALKIAQMLDAKYFQPFASSYRLQGRLSKKNAYLGIADPFQLKVKMENEFGHIRPVILGEKDSFDLTSGEIIYGEKNQMDFLIWEQLYATKKYAYELDPLPDIKILRENISAAFKKLSLKQKQLKYFPDVSFTLQVIDPQYYLTSTVSLRGDQLSTAQKITAKLPARLLQRILTKRSHWNSAEVGCHIDFIREPNEYNPDFHMLLSFFHT